MNGKGDYQSRERCCAFSGKGNWTGPNIAAMVIGFVLFWPIGLFFLYWIMKGRNVMDLRSTVANKWQRFKGTSSQSEGSDNEVFNEYQQTQYDRIQEIKQEIESRARRFTQFRSDAKRRADEEEFRRFMDDRDA